MQRLSSGYRINSARDDAAGLAIATRQLRQITGLSVAMRNANDGVSFAQTAEGAMDEMVNSLQRIYEISEQAASYNTSMERSFSTRLTVSAYRSVLRSMRRYQSPQPMSHPTVLASSQLYPTSLIHLQ